MKTWEQHHLCDSTQETGNCLQGAAVERKDVVESSLKPSLVLEGGENFKSLENIVKCVNNCELLDPQRQYHRVLKKPSP